MDYTPYPASLDKDATWTALESAQAKFEDRDVLQSAFDNVKICVGVDGYVDSLYSLVSKRESVDDFTIMESMAEFGTKVNDTAGSSCNVERVLKKMIGGGFGPNIARALATLGAKIDLIGCLGAPDEIFTTSLPDSVTFHSLANPGATCGLEFNDGKVMLTDFAPVNNVTWDLIKENVGKDQLIEMFDKVDAIGQGHWSLVPHLNEIWEAFIQEIFPSLSTKDHKDRIFFVDPADMTKRSAEHINDMIAKLEEINQVPGMKVVLSANDKEAIQLTKAIPGIGEINEFEDYYTAGEKMMAKFNIDALIIHHPQFATVSTKDDSWHVKEGYTSKPQFTTAAGDHFNGGLLISLASGRFTPAEALVAANACTAYFVRTGISPSLDLLSTFIANYKAYIDDDIDTIA